MIRRKSSGQSFSVQLPASAQQTVVLSEPFDQIVRLSQFPGRQQVGLGMFRLLQAHIIHHRHQMEVNGRDGILLSLQGKGGFHNADAFAVVPLR